MDYTDITDLMYGYITKIYHDNAVNLLDNRLINLDNKMIYLTSHKDLVDTNPQTFAFTARNHLITDNLDCLKNT